MLVYRLVAVRLLIQIDRVSYRVSGDYLRRTVDYYLDRTAHGSTLSRVVHASVLAQLHPGRAWELFRDALVADLDAPQGGTTPEGVHLGALARAEERRVGKGWANTCGSRGPPVH